MKMKRIFIFCIPYPAGVCKGKREDFYKKLKKLSKMTLHLGGVNVLIYFRAGGKVLEINLILGRLMCIFEGILLNRNLKNLPT